MRNLKKLFVVLIPAGVMLLFLILNLFNAFSFVDNRIFDALLWLRKTPQEFPQILLVDFDDASIEAAGTWPVSRSVFADGLVLMKEMKAAYTVFDIEFVDQSPRGINGEVLERDIPDSFDRELGYLSRSISDLFQAIRSGRIPLNEAEDYIGELVAMTDGSRDTLLSHVGRIARDNDFYLGQAARLFGNTYFTIHTELEEDPGIPADLKEYVAGRFALQGVELKGKIPAVFPEIRPAIMPLAKGAKGLGFTNAPIDEDGVQRRIDIVVEHDGKYYPQLSTGPLLDLLGNPGIEIRDSSIILKGAQIPGREPCDIKIPLSESRKVLINWPHAPYEKSFRHLSYSRLIAHKVLYDDLLNNLKDREDWGYLRPERYEGDAPIADLIRYVQSLRDRALEEGDPDGQIMEEYRAMQEKLLEQAGRLLDPETEKRILEEVGQALSMPGLSAGTRENYTIIRDDIPEFFLKTRQIHADLMKTRAYLADTLEGAFCIFGHTGTSTTDMGVNPFDKEFENVGTHAAIANTIIQGDFLDDTPAWLSLVIAAIASFALAFTIRPMKPRRSIITGIAVFAAVTVLISGFFVVTGVYVGVFTPSLAIFLVFLGYTLVKFLQVESEKGFLRKAFSHYLSTDVINTLIANPERLKLGGEKKLMTAMFTDIRGFSTISEQLDPESLVRLLNLYLSEMSDIVLDLQGTIDKYEGDAIIAFFNAPIDMNDHPARACLAAVRMRRAETLLNDRFIESGISPGRLFTRVGINTGEMVVGNMGTIKKMDYTIIGDSVNLAARLEGVNKNYGTAVTISEDTFRLAGDGFVTRRLDRIRVVGKKQPIRIYELIEEKGRISSETAELLGVFDEALGLFERRDWTGALAMFEKCLEISPEDGPALHYIPICRKYAVEPPAESWDGVFSLTSK